MIKIDDNTTVSDLLTMYVESKTMLHILDEIGVDESTALYRIHKKELEKTFDIIQSVAIRSGVGLEIFNTPTLRVKQLYDAT